MKLYVLGELYYSPKERFITKSIAEMKELPNNTTMEVLYKSETTGVFIGESETIYLNFRKVKVEELDGSIPDTVEVPETLKNKNGTWDEMFKRDGTMLLLDSRILHRDGLWLNKDTGMVSISQMFAKVPMKNETGYILFETNDHKVFMTIHGKAFYYNDGNFEPVTISKDSGIKIEMDISEVYADVYSWFLEVENNILDDDDGFHKSVYENIGKRKMIKAGLKGNGLMSTSEVLDRMQKKLGFQPIIPLNVGRDEKDYLNMPFGKITEMVAEHRNDDDILFYKNLYLSISKKLISTSISSLKNAIPNTTQSILIILENGSGFANVHGEGFRLRQLEHVIEKRLKQINFPLNYVDIHGKNDIEITLMFKQYTEEHGTPVGYTNTSNANYKFVNDMFLVSTQYPSIWINSENGKPYTDKGEKYSIVLSKDKALIPFNSIVPNWGKDGVLQHVVPIPGKKNMVGDRLANSVIDLDNLNVVGALEDFIPNNLENILFKRKSKTANTTYVTNNIEKADGKYYFSLDGEELDYGYDKDNDVFGWMHGGRVLYEDTNMNMCRLDDVNIIDPICKVNRKSDHAIVKVEVPDDLVFRIIKDT